MIIFFFEFLYFIAAIFAILVCVSSAALFVITYRYEQHLLTVWRAAGFIMLAIAFFMFIIERRFLDVELIGAAAVTIEMLALFSIFKGVRAEPSLSHLSSVGKPKKTKKLGKKDKLDITNTTYQAIGVIVLVALLPINYFFTAYVTSIFLVISAIIIIATLRIQIQRYQASRSNKAEARQNLYPLLAYVFLLFSVVSFTFYRLPEVNIVFLRKLTLDYSAVWQLGAIYTLTAFMLLGVWAWNYIKVRQFLRSYVIFLAVAIIVSTLGSLLFSLLIFNIVENNNLQLMQQAAESEELIMQERSRAAVSFSQVMAEDPRIINKLQQSSYPDLSDAAQKYLERAKVDRIRIYNNFGEILVSPTDPRDEGRVITDDPLLSFAILEKRQIKSFDVVPGVLAEVMYARAINPILSKDDEVIGAVEVDYIFDNAFVDFSQSITSLDATIYTGTKRAATTILTLDGVSRWVGSEESDQGVIDAVLNEGRRYKAVVDRLGVDYYSAFKPVRNVNGDEIGMISVGTPRTILIQDTREQLVNTFMLVTIISLLAALVGYAGLYSASRTKPATNKSNKGGTGAKS